MFKYQPTFFCAEELRQKQEKHRSLLEQQAGEVRASINDVENYVELLYEEVPQKIKGALSILEVRVKWVVLMSALLRCILTCVCVCVCMCVCE